MDKETRIRIIEKFLEIINPDRIELIKRVLKQRTRHLCVTLENIYYPQNASAVIRTSECLGIQDVHIIENTNTYQINPDVVRGASKWINLKRYKQDNNDNTTDCISALNKTNYNIVAMTLLESTVSLNDLPLDNKLAIFFGEEECGLSEIVLDNADHHVKIPISGFTQSFNLSVSAGITLHTLVNRLRHSDINWKLNNDDYNDQLLDWLTKSTPAGKTLLRQFENDLIKNI